MRVQASLALRAGGSRSHPQHPAELAELYARHLRHAVLAPRPADLGASVARFCAALREETPFG